MKFHQYIIVEMLEHSYDNLKYYDLFGCIKKPCHRIKKKSL